MKDILCAVIEQQLCADSALVKINRYSTFGDRIKNMRDDNDIEYWMRESWYKKKEGGKQSWWAIPMKKVLSLKK